MRHWKLGQTLNLRDLGGYETEDGGETAWGVFLRSALPQGLEERDVQRLRDAGITTAIDLRSDWEREKRPSALENQPGIAFYHCRMFGDGKMPEAGAQVPETYLEILRGTANMLAIMRTIAAAPGGVLYHCQGGKDRTGVTSALLLKLAGVSDEDVVADYATSEAYLQALIHRAEEGKTRYPLDVVVPRVSHMQGFLQLFYAEYGSVEAYLERIGLTQGEIGKIRNRLTKQK